MPTSEKPFGSLLIANPVSSRPPGKYVRATCTKKAAPELGIPYREVTGGLRGRCARAAGPPGRRAGDCDSPRLLATFGTRENRHGGEFLCRQAVVCTAYGPPDVLVLKQVPKPSPAPDEVLIRIVATTVTASDVLIRQMAGNCVMRLILQFLALAVREIPSSAWPARVSSTLSGRRSPSSGAATM